MRDALRMWTEGRGVTADRERRLTAPSESELTTARCRFLTPERSGSGLQSAAGPTSQNYYINHFWCVVFLSRRRSFESPAKRSKDIFPPSGFLWSGFHVWLWILTTAFRSQDPSPFFFFISGCCCSKSLLILYTRQIQIHLSVTAEEWF